MTTYVEETPLKESRRKPAGLVITRHDECPDCLVITNSSFNGSGSMIRIVPCQAHGDEALARERIQL